MTSPTPVFSSEPVRSTSTANPDSQRTNLVALVIGLVFLGGFAWSAWGDRATDKQQAASYRLDINEATWFEWIEVDAIGETLARRIIADRAEHGPFASIDDLTRVRGIGQKTVAKMRPFLQASPAPDRRKRPTADADNAPASNE